MKNMYRKNLIFVFALLIILQIPNGYGAFEIRNEERQTIGVDEFSNGYILFAPRQDTTTYLINNNGEVVHTWESDYKAREAVYLLENTHIIRGCNHGVNPTFWGGGASGYVEEFDWDGNLVWNFKYTNDKHCLHHDIEPLPNGNVLMTAWELKTDTEAIASGRDPDSLPAGVLWPSHIIEVKPTGATSGDIVWEWYAWDHLIQDFDPTKENYGIVGDHPELIDVNYGHSIDWNHVNSVDYNEDFDQIMLSVLAFSEIWIIDHSTTTEEAAGHTGGNSGKGGDLLYRWGNPHAYRYGDEEDQKFFWQHDARWIESGYPGEGNIMVFNNGVRRPPRSYSSVDEIVPPVDSDGNYFLMPGSAYGPEEQLWMYTSEDPLDFSVYILSGAQRLPNGNTLICNGQYGIFFEVTPEKNIVWEYANPFPLNSHLHGVFKIQHYDNIPPQKPSTPNGTNSGIVGVEYMYSSSTIDFEGDDIYYLFDWGDGTDTGWLGPHDSGDTVEANHTWANERSYDVKVKAKDVHDDESSWSDPLTVYIGGIPVIKIGDIYGGLFKISAVIKNNGNVDATGVDWSIVLDDGFILRGKETYGSIIILPAGEETTISSSLILGFGNTVITVSAETTESSDAAERDAFVLLFIIL